MEGNVFSLLYCVVINDNEGVVEMLIDILGVSIVNVIDLKGRIFLYVVVFIDYVECL